MMSKETKKIKKERNVGGRPPKPINYEQLDALCEIQCTGEECAAILGVSYEHLNNQLKKDGNTGFLYYFKEKSAGGKMSLRRRQFDHAMTGNATMLIWLGKQWLGQVDKIEDDNDDSSPEINKIIVEVVGANSVD